MTVNKHSVILKVLQPTVAILNVVAPIFYSPFDVKKLQQRQAYKTFFGRNLCFSVMAT
jgi:hypothetical protein